VVGGSDVTLTVSLREKAPQNGAVLALSSSSPGLTVPATITVAAGKTSATVKARTATVAVRTKALVTAALGRRTSSETVTIKPTQLLSIQAPETVQGGTHGTVTVTLTGPAGVSTTACAVTGTQDCGGDGVWVRIVGNRPSVMGVPSQVLIPAGETSATFEVWTVQHRGDAEVTLTAKLAGSPNKADTTVVLGTGFPDATATNTPEPTATETSTPEPTATNTEVPTATNTPEPTATNTEVPTATATNTAIAPPAAFTLNSGDGHIYDMTFCLTEAVLGDVSVTFGYTSQNPPMMGVDITPSSATLNTASPCTSLMLHSDDWDLGAVNITANINGTVYTSEAIYFGLV
jgi:hypothetical protein